LVETGDESMTGGRLKRVAKYLKKDEDFLFTYGDGLSDVNIAELIKFHRHNKKKATVTAVQPPGRFGALNIDNSQVLSFREKPEGDDGWINGGFFVLNPQVIEYIEGDETIWERLPMERLAKEGQLSAFHHKGFWHPMDTLRDKMYLEDLWTKSKAPWKNWT
jgi:glucose-1-phosphate cytidylyltransferase